MKRSTLVICQTRTLIGRAVASALIPAMALTTVPMPASAAPPAPSVILSPRLPAIVGEGSQSAVPAPSLPSPISRPPSVVPTPPKVTVNRTVPKVSPAALYPTFSAQPTAAEIFHARVFSEPLVAIGETTAAENAELAQAITSYVHGASPDQVAPFEGFLSAHAGSAWRASLLANLASLYWRTGLFTRAVATWGAAWQLAKDATDVSARATADRAVGELMQALAAFGRTPELQAISAEVGKRVMRGTAAENVRQAREGLALMLDHRDLLYPSAVVAIGRVLARTRPDYKGDPQLANYHAGHYGVSLVEARDLAERVGLKLQMAWRPKGAAIVVPSIVHSRLEHYAAIVAKDEATGRYLLDDPLVLGQTWVSEAALSEDSSGYTLIPAGASPDGWREVRESEAAVVMGRCRPPQIDDGGPPCPPGKCPCIRGAGGPGSGGPGAGGPGGGGPPTLAGAMAGYQLLRDRAALRIADTPVGYSPARGPAVDFMVAYNHRQALQPQTFGFSNMGPRWSHNYLSWVEDDPANLSGDILLFLRGGGYERHRDITDPAYKPNWASFTALVRTSTSPIRYEARHEDGSLDVYSQPDGAMTAPRRTLLTDVIDAQGQSLHLTYDAQLRLVAITDALGQVTTLSYDDAADTLKLTKVSDPFGRSATFEYDSNGALVRITDVIGIQSQLGYGSGDFIDSLTTPYGTTNFHGDQAEYGFGDGLPYNAMRVIEATDPLGSTERVEYRVVASSGGPPSTEAVVPTGFSDYNVSLDIANSYYWDKRAMALYPGDYSKAEVTHWLKASPDMIDLGLLLKNYLAPIPHSVKKPLERRVWYAYAGTTPANYDGSFTNATIQAGYTSRPSKVGRVLDDGSSQIYQYQYNSKGKTTRSTDPLGRTTVYVYDTNDIDLLQVRQVNGTNTEQLASYTYNDKHQQLTSTDASGQTTTYTYTATNRVHTVTNAKNETTTYAYNANDQLASVTGPVSGTTTTYEYDGYGRVWRVTDPEGYAVTRQYDALDRVTTVTYPDGTYEETDYDKLDAVKQRDRLGRWTQTFYDALRRPVATRDPAGRITQKNEWVSCPSGCGGGGAKISKLIDANGNATTWEYDLEGRVTQEIRPSGATYNYTYENTTSRLASIQDPNGNVKTFAYNRDDTRAGITYQPGSGVAATPNVSFTYDPVYGRVATMTDGTGTTTYAYYPVGVLGAGRPQTVDGPLDNDTVTYGYDELGRAISTQIGSSANTQTQAFDSLGRLATLTNPQGNFTYTYDGVTARPMSVTYPNGQVTSYAYFGNAGDRRLQEIWNKTPGGATLSKFDYTYNAVGNISTWQQQAGSSAAQVYQFGYDDADQLTAAIVMSTDPTPVVLKRYYYASDPAGNRTAEQIDDAVTASTYNNMNQLVSQAVGGALIFKGTVSEPATVTVGGKPATVTADNHFTGAAAVPGGTGQVVITAKDYSNNLRTNTYQVTESGAGKNLVFDVNGNMTSDGTRSFTWDAENRLVAVTWGTQRSEFTYDGFWRRVHVVERASGAIQTETRAVWCGMELCEERAADGVTVTRRLFPHGEQVGGLERYFTTDHLGSVRDVTDASGALLARYAFDPWGQRTVSAGTDVTDAGLAGHRQARSGLSLALYRGYDAETGRWVSEDPLGVSGGINLYRYSNGNPTNRIDPLGLATQCREVGRAPWYYEEHLEREPLGPWERTVHQMPGISWPGRPNLAPCFAIECAYRRWIEKKLFRTEYWLVAEQCEDGCRTWKRARVETKSVLEAKVKSEEATGFTRCKPITSALPPEVYCPEAP